MQLIVQNIIRFLLLIVVQIFVLDNIQLYGYLNPMLYILAIIALPIHTPQNITLLLSFALGLTIDMFSNTMGLHTFATVLLGFCRTPTMRLFLPYGELLNKTPTPHYLGAIPYAKYLIVLVLIHHTALFVLESFSFYTIDMVLLKMLVSSLITITLIVAIQSITIERK